MYLLDSGYDLLFDVMLLGTRSPRSTNWVALQCFGVFEVYFEIFSQYMNMFSLAIVYHVIFRVHGYIHVVKIPKYMVSFIQKHILFRLFLSDLFLK